MSRSSQLWWFALYGGGLDCLLKSLILLVGEVQIDKMMPPVTYFPRKPSGHWTSDLTNARPTSSRSKCSEDVQGRPAMMHAEQWRW